MRAPFNGTVVQILKSEGAFLEKSGTNIVVRIDDLSQLFATTEVAELDYARLKIGQSANIKATAIQDRNYKGEIIQISQAAIEQERWDRSKVEFPVKIKILDQDDQLKPGMSVVLDVITAEARDFWALLLDLEPAEA